MTTENEPFMGICAAKESTIRPHQEGAPCINRAVTVHERDCAPCDAARAVVAELAAAWDPNDYWRDVEIGGATVYDQGIELAAKALHKFPMPGGRR